MSHTPLRVAIIGGGIGGLAAAHALLREGIEVTVHEQAAQLGEVGAGVQLAPNGYRPLERYGLADAINEVAVVYQPGSQYLDKDGAVIAPSVIEDEGGTRLRGIHRADLLSVLVDNLPDGVVHTGHRAVSFSQDETSATVVFENGDAVTADVVVGADGIHSLLRGEIVEPSHPEHSGKIAYRGLVPAEKVPHWPTDRFQVWRGEGKHFLVFPVRSGTLINYVGFVPSGELIRESWSAPGDPEKLRSEFAGWDPVIGDLLAQVEQTFWWALNDREPISTWSKGRLTLLGDAAHPMLPHLGQGANQSIEDGAALGVLLSGVSPEDAPAALVAYEGLRKERTGGVQNGSRANGRRYDSENELDVEERDSDLASTKDMRLSIYNYDAEAAARAVLAQPA